MPICTRRKPQYRAVNTIWALRVIFLVPQIPLQLGRSAEVRQSATGVMPVLARILTAGDGKSKTDKAQDLSPLRLSLHESLPSIVFPVKTDSVTASPDPRYETQRGRNADGQKDLQVVIHDNLQSLQLAPGGSAPKIC